MDILFLESMRIFKGNRGRVIFKLRLPKLSGDSFDSFNSFYSSLLLAYADAAEHFSECAVGDARFLVSFKAEELEIRGRRRIKRNRNSESPCSRRLRIARTAALSLGGSRQIYESVDVYDLKYGFFVK